MHAPVVEDINYYIYKLKVWVLNVILVINSISTSSNNNITVIVTL